MTACILLWFPGLLDFKSLEFRSVCAEQNDGYPPHCLLPLVLLIIIQRLKNCHFAQSLGGIVYGGGR